MNKRMKVLLLTFESKNFHKKLLHSTLSHTYTRKNSNSNSIRNKYLSLTTKNT